MPEHNDDLTALSDDELATRMRNQERARDAAKRMGDGAGVGIEDALRRDLRTTRLELMRRGRADLIIEAGGTVVTFMVGDAVRITSGIWGGRTGVVTGVVGDVHTVEFVGPKFIFDSDGQPETKRLPYDGAELTNVERGGK